jgi:hypothetical protein
VTTSSEEVVEGQLVKHRDSTHDRVNERFYEKVIKVKADVAALLNLFSDVSIAP